MITLPDGILRPDWSLLPPGFGAITTLRSGGVSLAPYDDGRGAGGFNLGNHVGDREDDVLSNRQFLSRFLPDNVSCLVWLNQVHGTTVVNLDEKPVNLIADSSMSMQPGVVCAIMTADCLPVLFCCAEPAIVAAAHAGWRGLANGVLENTVEKMRAAGARPEHIIAWLGPAIGPLQFEVGNEVRERFMKSDIRAACAFKENTHQPGKFYADIYKLARQQLQHLGVQHIAGGDYCTFSDPDRFYSYRRDGVTGRMASLIWIKAS